MIIKVCCGNACSGKFSSYMITRVKNDIEHSSLKNIEIEESKCMGQCKKGPNAKINDEIINFANGAKLSEAIFKKLKR